MNIDLKTFIKLSDFAQEDKKKILDAYDTLTGEEMLKLWEVCLDNLLWKFEITFSKKFHEMVYKGIQMEKDTQDYENLEREVLAEILRKADLEGAIERIEKLRAMLKNYQSGKTATNQASTKLTNLNAPKLN